MTTSNTIQANYLEDALYIPIEAVFKNDSLSFVYLNNGQETKQIIEPGETNENYVVVHQGLEEGQKIALVEPTNAEEYELVGFEIFADIKQKAIEKKAKEEEERKKKENQPKKTKLPPGMKLPAGAVISSASK